MQPDRSSSIAAHEMGQRNLLGLRGKTLLEIALGQIQSITPLTAQWLQTYFVNPTDPDYLPDHLWSWVRSQISSFTTNYLPRVCLPLRITQADKQLVIRFFTDPLSDRYLLLLEEQSLLLLDSLALLGLSQREAEVLQWVLRGKDNLEISKQLEIHFGTVRKHLENIYRKLGVQSRTEAIAKALEELGMVNA